MANDLLDIETAETIIGAAPNFTDSQLDIAVEIVRRHCGWHIAPVRTETLTVDGNGSTELVLPTLRLTDLATCTVDGVAVSDVEWSTNGTIERRSRFPRKRRAVVVEVEHGHDACPDDVVGVVVTVAARIPFSTGGDGVEAGLVEEQLGSYRYRLSDSVQTEGFLTDADLFVLGAHRVPPTP